MRTTLVALLLLLLAMPAAAQQVGSFVDIAQNGETSSGAFALTVDGYLFQGVNSPDNTWTYLGSIPDLAGRPATAPFVALANWIGYDAPAALTSAGEFYYFMGNYWHCDGTIGDLSGHQTQGEFVALERTAYIRAISDDGDIYRWNYVVPEWLFECNVAEAAGVVITKPQSIGGVKVLFR